MSDLREPPAIVSSLRRGPGVMRLVAAFAAVLPSLYDEIEKTLAGDDLPQVAELAHRLKGSAGGYGFSSLMDAAAELEILARRDAPDDCRAAAARLRALVRRVRNVPVGERDPAP